MRQTEKLFTIRAEKAGFVTSKYLFFGLVLTPSRALGSKTKV